MAMDWTRVYRPQDFHSYVGNKVIKNKVQSMFKNNRVPQTILLQGDRGCGKTTLARLMAKNLMCKNRGTDGIACDNCASCEKLNEKFIATGEAPGGMSVYEKDITQANKVEDAAQIVDQMRQKSLNKTNRVFILDEVQRASAQAQNSFLKIAEEPGENLYIILCTTDPEDLIDPFKSRFNILPVKRPGVKEIVDRLEYICREEGVTYDKEGLRLIASQSERIPRESIKQLAMIATNSDSEVTYKRVVEELQMVRIGLYHRFMELMNADVFSAMQFIDDLYEEHGVDWSDFLKQFSTYLIDVFNMRIGVRLDKYSDAEYTEARKIYEDMDVKEIGRCLSLVEEALKSKEHPRFVLTMLTLKMGYPDYLKGSTEAEAKADRSNESREGLTVYKSESKQMKREQEDSLDKQEDDEVEDDIVQSLTGAEKVKGLDFIDDLTWEEDDDD